MLATQWKHQRQGARSVPMWPLVVQVSVLVWLEADSAAAWKNSERADQEARNVEARLDRHFLSIVGREQSLPEVVPLGITTSRQENDTSSVAFTWGQAKRSQCRFGRLGFKVFHMLLSSEQQMTEYV